MSKPEPIERVASSLLREDYQYARKECMGLGTGGATQLQERAEELMHSEDALERATGGLLKVGWSLIYGNAAKEAQA